MNVERMRLLEQTLERVIAEDRPFGMQYWFSAAPDDCGTAACAGGWLCREPEANAQGLAICGSFPTYKGQYGIYALAFYLDIDFRQVVRLFHSGSYGVKSADVRPSHVLARVRELLARERGEGVVP